MTQLIKDNINGVTTIEFLNDSFQIDGLELVRNYFFSSEPLPILQISYGKMLQVEN